jgi:hypothetical protein
MKEEIYELMYAIEPTYWWYVARRQTIMTQVERLLRARRDPSVRPCILDYGCGTGLNLMRLSTLGDAYGLMRLFSSRSMYRGHIKPLGSTVNALLTRSMAVENRVLPYVNLTFGGSLLCCARKGSGQL